MIFSKNIVVTDKEWKKELEANWNQLREYWKSFEGEGDLYNVSVERFYNSGDVNDYIAKAIEKGERPDWRYVLTCNPSRDFDQLLSNIKLFWSWVLDDPDNRLPDQSDSRTKVSPQDYFDHCIFQIGGLNSPVVDPISSAKLFHMAFGETFSAEHVFPMALGTEQWHPIERPDAEKQFWEILICIKDYLFAPKPAFLSRQCLWLVDYWFSTVPLLEDMRMFDTNLKKHDGVKDKKRRMSIKDKQSRIRVFLALLNGYPVLYAGKNVRHNDSELEEYIRVRLAGMDMPPEYHRLVEFIHKYKTKCLNKSE